MSFSRVEKLGIDLISEVIIPGDFNDQSDDYLEPTEEAKEEEGIHPWFEEGYDLRYPAGDPKKIRDNAESRIYTGDPLLAVYVTDPNPGKITSQAPPADHQARQDPADPKKIRDAAACTLYTGAPELATYINSVNPDKISAAVPAAPHATLFYGAEGPTEFSNWIIPGHVIAGAYPGHRDAEQHAKIVQQVIDAGTDVFVNLLLDREQKTMRPYRGTAAKAKAQRDGQPLTLLRLKTDPLASEEPLNKHHQIQIIKQRDTAIIALIHVLMDLIGAGKVIYIHDYGGHGRTSIVCACLIALYYDVSSHDALKIVELSHGKRKNQGNWKHTIAFHMPSQHDQVHRLIRTLTSVAPVIVKKEYTRTAPLIEVPTPKTGRQILQPPGGKSSISFGSLMAANPDRDDEKHGFAVLSPPGGKSSIIMSDQVPTSPVTNEIVHKTRTILKPPGGDSSKIFG